VVTSTTIRAGSVGSQSNRLQTKQNPRICCWSLHKNVSSSIVLLERIGRDPSDASSGPFHTLRSYFKSKLIQSLPAGDLSSHPTSLFPQSPISAPATLSFEVFWPQTDSTCDDQATATVNSQEVSAATAPAAVDRNSTTPERLSSWTKISVVWLISSLVGLSWFGKAAYHYRWSTTAVKP
jgi:hypothetical protein